MLKQKRCLIPLGGLPETSVGQLLLEDLNAFSSWHELEAPHFFFIRILQPAIVGSSSPQNLHQVWVVGSQTVAASLSCYQQLVGEARWSARNSQPIGRCIKARPLANISCGL